MQFNNVRKLRIYYMIITSVNTPIIFYKISDYYNNVQMAQGGYALLLTPLKNTSCGKK